MSVEQHIVVRALMAERVKLFAYIVSIVRDEHLAEDVLQEVSIVALDKREEIRDPACLPAWLRETARYKSLKALSRLSKRPLTLDNAMLDLLEAEWCAYDRVAGSTMTDMLRSCLSKLSPYARRIVDLRYGENLKSGQVAEMLGRKAHTVYIALQRIHRDLANCMQRQIDCEEGVGGA